MGNVLVKENLSRIAWWSDGVVEWWSGGVGKVVREEGPEIQTLGGRRFVVARIMAIRRPWSPEAARRRNRGDDEA